MVKVPGSVSSGRVICQCWSSPDLHKHDQAKSPVFCEKVYRLGLSQHQPHDDQQHDRQDGDGVEVKNPIRGVFSVRRPVTGRGEGPWHRRPVAVLVSVAGDSQSWRSPHFRRSFRICQTRCSVMPKTSASVFIDSPFRCRARISALRLHWGKRHPRRGIEGVLSRDTRWPSRTTWQTKSEGMICPASPYGALRGPACFTA
jgi:hypothetical protein